MTANIKEIFENNLVSLFNYQKHSIEFLVLVIQNTNYEQLKKAKSSLKKHNLIIMTKLDFKEGHDVFPIEFLDMKSSYKMIEGEDLLKDLIIQKTDLRHQLEHEIRSKLIHLKDQFIQNEERDFILRILPTLTPIIKSLLFLKNIEFSNQLDDNLSKLQEAYKIDPAFLSEIAEIEEGKKRTDKEKYPFYIQRLDELLTNLVNKIN